MTAKELLQRMPEALDREAAGDTEAVIQYQTGEPMYQVLQSGELTTYEGVAEDPDLTITISEANLVKLFYGELNPMSAFMMGKVKVRGDMGLAQRLVGFVNRDKLEEMRA